MKISRLLVVLLLLSVPFTGGCFGCAKVPAGYKGVKVYLLGGDKGVDAEEVGTGYYFLGWNTDLFLFPVFTQNYVWTADKREGSPEDESITFQTSEGLSVNGDFGISFSVKPEMVDILFQKYRKGVNEITDIYLRNMVRDALVALSSTQPVANVYGQGKAKLMADVENMVREQCLPIGILIDRIYLVGDFRLPEKVIASINAKIEATQRAEQRENERREAAAEAAKSVEKARGEAESITLKAKAQAEANLILAKSLTPELVRYKTVEKWDGILPKISGDVTPMVSLGDITK